MSVVISFDMDGTLVKSHYADAVWLEGVPKVYAKEYGIPLEKAKDLLFKQYAEVSEQRMEWYDIAYWFQRFRLKTDWHEVLQSYAEVIEPYEEVHEVLRNLHGKVPLIVCSNAKKEFIDIQLQTTGLSRYFTHMFSSITDFQLVKKDTSFYQQVCDILDIRPDELYHVGDHREFDFQSPQSIGINAYHLDRTAKILDDSTFPSLKEFYMNIYKTL